MKFLLALACLFLAGYLANKFWIIKVRLRTVIGVSVAGIILTYGILVLFSYHCLLLAEKKCMPDYGPLKALHVERVVEFGPLGWSVGYNCTHTVWFDAGNPSIEVNLLGRVVFATPPYVIDAVQEYQGGILKD